MPVRPAEISQTFIIISLAEPARRQEFSSDAAAAIIRFQPAIVQFQFSLVYSSGKTSTAIPAVKSAKLTELAGFTIAIVTGDFNRNSVQRAGQSRFQFQSMDEYDQGATAG